MAHDGSLCQRSASEGARGELRSGSRCRAGARAAECIRRYAPDRVDL
jgi:hypothetical protein